MVVKVADFQGLPRCELLHFRAGVQRLHFRCAAFDLGVAQFIVGARTFRVGAAYLLCRVRAAFGFRDRHAFAAAAPSIASRRLTLDRDAKVIHVSVLQEFDP